MSVSEPTAEELARRDVELINTRPPDLAGEIYSEDFAQLDPHDRETPHDASGLVPARRPGLLGVVTRKVVAVGVRGYSAGSRLAYRSTRLATGAITHVDHVTVPCADLGVAEEFYVGLLGARVVLRLDEQRLERMGWSVQDIRDNHAAHLAVAFGAGPRLDLFEYPGGVPSADAPMHPHLALAVGPRSFLSWKRRLEERGVTVAGPTRPGPPGQGSFYFNDPFGNHLELVTLGFTAEVLKLGVPPLAQRATLGYTWTR